VTTLATSPFDTNSVGPSWFQPAYTSGTNGACLTAGPDVAASEIPNCTPTTQTSPNGALRLTTNANSQVGAVLSSSAIPLSQGLDVAYGTYQYNGTGADGISFIMAATNPNDPTPPPTTGPLGGALGYSTNQSNPGVANGYLGFGLDVFGNYENSAYGGASCSEPTGLTPGDAYPESVTVRGPGTGTTGYCILNSTAEQHLNVGNNGSSNGTISNVGSGLTLDAYSATSRSSAIEVPVEIVLNPTTSTLAAPNNLGSSGSTLSVGAGEWEIAFTPLGTGATEQTLTGSLPNLYTSSGVEQQVLQSYPANYINQTTGYPNMLSYGWAASTGGSNEIHEVNTLTATTAAGPIADYQLTNTDSSNGQLTQSSTPTYTLTPSLVAGQGAETETPTLTDTFPTGITPTSATSTSSNWSCSISGQTVSCTYPPPGGSIAAGTTLPSVTVDTSVSSTAAGQLNDTAKISSADSNPATATDTGGVFAASANPSSVVTSGATALSVAGLPAAATGSVAFTTGSTTLCTISDITTTTSCSAKAPTTAGSYTVDAVYTPTSSAYTSQSSSTVLSVASTSTSFTDSVSPTAITYGAGTAVTLSETGLPSGAGGTVTYDAGSTELCSAAPGSTCTATPTLQPNTYNVTAAYSGSGTTYAASNATNTLTLTVNQATVTLGMTAGSSTVADGATETFTDSGIPTGQTGTVVVTNSQTGDQLCTIDVSSATSCTATITSTN
jgi:hypothetical protein